MLNFTIIFGKYIYIFKSKGLHYNKVIENSMKAPINWKHMGPGLGKEDVVQKMVDFSHVCFKFHYIENASSIGCATYSKDAF